MVQSTSIFISASLSFLILCNAHALVVTDLYGDKDGFGIGFVTDTSFSNSYPTLINEDAADLGTITDQWLYGSQSWTHTYDLSGMGEIVDAQLVISTLGQGFHGLSSVYFDNVLVGQLTDGDNSTILLATNWSRLDTFDLTSFGSLDGVNIIRVETVGSLVLPDDRWALDYSELRISDSNISTGILFLFPLNIMCGEEVCNAFTARILSVQDHSVPTGYNCNRSGTCDGVVSAFNGEEGRIEYGRNASPPGYQMDAFGSTFLLGTVNYTGINHNQPCYDGAGESIACSPGKSYLNYDGHAGYDYACIEGVDAILAPADGVLSIPIEDTINGTPNTFNTFMITHENSYETWFLHAQAGTITSPGDVIKGQIVAMCGKEGAAGPHLHFEVRQGSYHVVDPYLYDLWEIIDAHDHDDTNVDSGIVSTNSNGVSGGGGGAINKIILFILLITFMYKKLHGHSVRRAKSANDWR